MRSIDLVVALGDRMNDLDQVADRQWTRDVAYASINRYTQSRRA